MIVGALAGLAPVREAKVQAGSPGLQFLLLPLLLRLTTNTTAGAKARLLASSGVQAAGNLFITSEPTTAFDVRKATTCPLTSMNPGAVIIQTT